MDAPVEPPRRRHPHRRSRETTFDVQPMKEPVASHEDSEAVDENVVKELNDIKENLEEMEKKLTSRQQEVMEKREKGKNDVKELFDLLHELLERKECDMNEKIDDEYDKIDDEIIKELETLQSIRDPVDEMVDKHKYGVRGITNDMLRNLNASTQNKMVSCGNSGNRIPEVSVNFDCENMLEELKYAELFTGEAVSGNEQTEVGGTNETLNVESEPRLDRSENISEQVSSSGSHHAVSESDDTEETSHENGHHNFDESSFSENRDGATASVAPSAPSLVMITDNGEEVEDPPPYWQAVGLAGPMEESPPIVPPLNVHTYGDPSPSYCDSYPRVVRNNTLELWHSFPIRRRYDVRKPLYVALSWDDQRICVADRSNRKVKFFSRTGDPLTEMNISSGEVHDVAFLEEYGGESRYIITLPKERTLLLVSVMENNTTKLVRKIVMNKSGSFYSSICRGPREQTLVGSTTIIGNFYNTTEKPRVEMFDFEGNVLQVYKGTISFVEFEYPRSVQVCRDMVIVADWKLSLVAVFLSDGTQIGQYNGTSQSPLLNPLDLALDPYCNVMIVDGENPSIHVISPEGLPIEVIKVPKCGSELSKPKLLAFDKKTKDRLAVIRSTGDLAIFSFRDGYQAIQPGELEISPASPVSVPISESLPFVEGMLPTTIASIGRGSRQQRRPNFFL